MPSMQPYPNRADFRHGDLVFPRRQDVQAITSPPELLLDGLLTQPVEDGKPFDLVAYWPRLLALLRQVESGALSIRGMLLCVRADLGRNFNAADAAEAIIGKQYVGHCAIVDMRHPSGLPWVIEASHDFGAIRCMPYDDWETSRRAKNAFVWHARISALSRDDTWAERFVDYAHEYRMLRTPYAIFDDDRTAAKFVLDMPSVEEAGQDNYLYCSELVVACADRLLSDMPQEDVQKLGNALLDLRMRRDGSTSGSNDDFKMVTPKDLTLAKAIELVSGMGPYFRRPNM